MAEGKGPTLARQKAQDLRDLFVVKNLRKLVSILEAKESTFQSAEELHSSLNLGNLEGQLQITFTDGSRFDVKNAVVWSQSILGKQFCRFPLTFHNVTLPDGKTLEKPSEKRMNTLFLNVAQPCTQK